MAFSRRSALACILAAAACTPARSDRTFEQPADGAQAGRARVLAALRIEENEPDASRLFGTLSTLWSSGRHLLGDFEPERDDRAIPLEETLADGTVVGGLLFPFDGPAPLWLASFGLLQHRWGTEARKFFELYLEDPDTRIPAHVAILDHPTSAPFLANNGHLSMGAYDDARMWMEIVPRLRRRLPVSTVHLLGISMSGQTVVHAMLEDRRRHTGLFASGLAVSIAPDFARAPGGHLALLETPPGVENPWANDPGLRLGSLERRLQTSGLRVMIDNQFVETYRNLRPDDASFALARDAIPTFFRDAFERRIDFLRRKHRHDPTWNPAVPLTDLDSYLRATRIAGVIGRMRAPLVLVSARDDPAVPRGQFLEVAAACRDNGWIALHETVAGGHFGFEVAYGAEYLGALLRLLMDPAVLENWLTGRSGR